mmetsp:Transcript_96938/g.167219  ORF Transcript_96938/g.167219 Transcript_96938/m.167219 type:complete len:291 (-) Transcript_96938:477-1349(-)
MSLQQPSREQWRTSLQCITRLPVSILISHTTTSTMSDSCGHWWHQPRSGGLRLDLRGLQVDQIFPVGALSTTIHTLNLDFCAGKVCDMNFLSNCPTFRVLLLGLPTMPTCFNQNASTKYRTHPARSAMLLWLGNQRGNHTPLCQRSSAHRHSRAGQPGPCRRPGTVSVGPPARSAGPQPRREGRGLSRVWGAAAGPAFLIMQRQGIAGSAAPPPPIPGASRAALWGRFRCMCPPRKWSSTSPCGSICQSTSANPKWTAPPWAGTTDTAARTVSPTADRWRSPLYPSPRQR